VPVTLGWLLGQRQLGLAQLEGPDPAGVEVRWAHAIELADPTPWLAGGELVLTTGLRLPTSSQGLRDYVRRLADVGAAALGFGVGLGHERTPPAVREACAEAALPVLEVPLPTPFVAIVRAIADREAADQRASLQRTVDFQQQLTRAALQRGVAGLVESLATALRCPAVVIDDRGGVVARAGDRPALADQVRREVQQDADQAARTVVTGDGATLMLMRLAGGRRTRGWLALETAEPPSPAERLLVGQVSSMLSLQLTRSADLSALFSDLGAAALELGASLSRADPHPLARFGLDTTAGVRVVVAAPRDGLPAPTAELDAALESVRRPYVCAGREDVALAIVGADLDEEALAPAATRLRARRRDVVLGLSGPQPLDRVARALAEARRAAASARASRRSLVGYRALELESLVDDDAVRTRITDLAGSPLATLLASDRDGDRELVRTLRAYLEANGSWEDGSRRLGIHRHTLRQRIVRIGADTGLDLDSAHARAATLLVLLAHERDA